MIYWGRRPIWITRLANCIEVTAGRPDKFPFDPPENLLTFM
jgi:hypothetical protein